MSLRKEQVLLILVVLLGAYLAQGYFSFTKPIDRWRPQEKEYEAQPLADSLLVQAAADALVRRDFMTEPSETRPLPPRELAFPPHAAASLAALPLDPGPDFRHSWMLRQDGEQVAGVTVTPGGGNSAPSAVANLDGQEPGNPGPMSEEQASELYDRLWTVGLPSPNYGRIEPQDGVDLFALEESGNFEGVTLRFRIFSRKKRKLATSAVAFGGNGQAIAKIALRKTLINEVKRQVRRVPEIASAQNERLKLILWLLNEARNESWVYEEAQKQAEIYLQHSGGNLDGLRIMQVVLQATGSISDELDLLNSVTGDATAQSFKLQGLGVIKARMGLWIAAEEDLKEAARLTPTDARAHGTLAEFYRSRGRSREAVAAAARAESTLGTVQDEALRQKILRTIMSCRLAIGILAGNGNLAAAPAYVRGCMHYAAGDMTAATSSFQQVGTGPDATAAMLGQAACLVNTGSFQEAYDLFERVAEQDPLLRHRAMTGLALICSRISDFDSALTFLDRALEASPNDTYALYLRGRTLRLMGQFAAAEEAIEQTLVQHDDFLHAIVEMSLVQTGLASQAIGADQAAFLIGARRYMDRAVALSPKPELELFEMQGMRAFAAADRRAARTAFENAEALASSDELKGYAKGAQAVVAYSRGRVEEARRDLERLERDVGRDSTLGKWAGDTLTDIADHAEKETLGDSFDRQLLGDIWDKNQDGRLKPVVEGGRCVFKGKFEGKAAVSVARANGVKPAKNFLACSVTMAVGPSHDKDNATMGLAIETRRGRAGIEFSARVGIHNGKPYVEVLDGRDEKGPIRIAPDLNVALRTDGPQDLELRVVPRTGDNNNQLQLLVYFNSSLVLSHELKQLSGSTPSELRTVLFAEGDERALVDVAFDDYLLERRKGK
tara:strand:- start:905 stop:3589 length:2685 start_codon:yes stop_codon:yes gene_type:complete